MSDATRENMSVESDARGENEDSNAVQSVAVRRVPTGEVIRPEPRWVNAIRTPSEIATPGAGGLAQTFGLDIRAAVLTLLVDVMVFGGNLLSFGLLFFVGVMAAAVLGVIVFKIQMHWYGDDRESARIKAWVVALLTAIPVPLTPLVVLPCGLIGLARYLRQPR
jgi:hypothetical protein